MRKLLLPALLLLAIALGAFWYGSRQPRLPAETIVSTTFKSLQEQKRLTVFTARFVTVVSSSKSRYGFEAEKTMIVPSMVRYEIDLAKLKGVDWDGESNSVGVALPPVEIGGPEFDLQQVREFESGTVLLALTDVEKRLDAENRSKAVQDVLEQAKSVPLQQLVRDAATRAIRDTFQMPLKAAGVDARIDVGFANKGAGELFAK